VYHETGAPDVLRYEDVPDPAPGPGEVLIRVEAVSIEGGDTLNRSGGLMPATPHIVGYQCAGTIVGVGDGVTDRSEGQRVVATMPWGSHAELATTMVTNPMIIAAKRRTLDTLTSWRWTAAARPLPASRTAEF